MRQRTLPVVLAISVTAACLGDPVGAGSLLLVPDLATDSVISGHPGEALAHALRIRAVTANGGQGIAAARVEWILAGAGAQVQAASSQTDSEGYASAVWVLGTKASEQQGLQVRITAGSHTAGLAYQAAAVPYVVHAVRLAPAGDSTIRLGDSLRCALEAVDPFGNLFPAPSPRFVSLDTATIKIDSVGRLRPVRRGRGVVVGTAASAADSLKVNVIQIVQSITTAVDTFRFHAIGQVVSDSVRLLDDRGLVVKDSVPQVRLIDTTIARLVQPYPLTLRSSANGTTLVRIQAGTMMKDLGVVVVQLGTTVQVGEPSLTFVALGDTVRLTTAVVDSLGVPLTRALVTYSSTDSTIVTVTGDGLVRSRRTGAALLVVRANTGVTDTVPVTVNQTPASIQAVLVGQPQIVMSALDSLIPLTCRVFDRNGNVIDTMPSVSASFSGHWIGPNCGTLRAKRSGLDTMRVQAGGLEADVPIVLAVRPIPSSAIGDFLQVDSLPTGGEPWAPTARRNSRGEFEIYFAAAAELRSDLHRLVSTDGITFRYDGLVLQHDDSVCAPQGSGIENVSIVPRADGPGWRMFFAAGSFNCYGWQVFSAVSTDERTWLKEPGVRLTNGGTLPPDAPVSTPWPVGEGMVTEQLPSGEWQIIVAGYEHITPYEDKFQIVEWRSLDQVNWSYVGPVLTTREMPAAGQGTIYSPTIRQIAPGLWRMIFSGDNRFQPGWRGGIWSAVSTDKRSWQVEGELMGGPQTRLWYASLVDDRLVLIRQDDGDSWRLAIATVVMP